MMQLDEIKCDYDASRCDYDAVKCDIIILGFFFGLRMLRLIWARLVNSRS